jgi:hypothetical protein
MGAELILHALWWEKDREIDWDAGFARIAKLKLKKSNDITKDDLRDKLNNVKLACNDQNSEGAVLEIDHLKILIAGGDSWGDDPSELYTDLSTLLEYAEPVLHAAGFLMLIDYKVVLLKILQTKNILPMLLGIDDNLDKMIAVKLKE